jgi:hypothetical protein
MLKLIESDEVSINGGRTKGIDHIEGMTIRFDNDFDRINFLMKWGPLKRNTITGKKMMFVFGRK